jgi:hypothetical protein
MITPCLSLQKYTRTERHSLPESHDSSTRSRRCNCCMLPNFPSLSLSWFPYTSGRNNSVWVISICELSSHPCHRCKEAWCKSCATVAQVAATNWLGSKSTRVNWIRNNNVEFTLCMFNPFWITNSLHSRQVCTKNNANNLPGRYTREHDSYFKYQRLLTGQFAAGNHIFFHLRNGTRYSWWSVTTASEDMKKTNLTLQLCSMLSIHVIPQWKLFTSLIRATPCSKIK